jgi:glyoxylase-like metal-dependent hydrolase (beta-lactamase superfamily II)
VLEQVAEGVLVHESAWCQSNAVVVQGATGVLVIDPGIHGDELTCLANDIARLGENVVAGFSTHPHWDHLLWHVSLGSPPRYGTELTSTTARDRLAGGLDSRRLGIPDDTPLDLVGLITGLPAGTTRLSWEGPEVRIVEHQAHAPGHAALLIEEQGVLVAGDMLSDVLIPMLDLGAPHDPIEDYLAALRLFEAFAARVAVVVPGHGSTGDSEQLRERIEQDRAYLHALRDGQAISDPRIGPSPHTGWEWVRGVHERQLQALVARSESDGARY